MQYIIGNYNDSLVIVSILIAILSAVVALDLSAFALEYDNKRDQRKWLIIAGIGLGLGIWIMHFIGMLALELPIPIHYVGGRTLASIAIAIVGCLTGFFICFEKQKLSYILSGGLIMGLSITAMHYTGMAAMHMSAKMVYDPYLVGLSGMIAIFAATTSLVVMFTNKVKFIHEGLFGKLSSALLMGLAIAAMHYTGMAAISFIPDGELLTMVHDEFLIEGSALIVPLAMASSGLIILPLFAKDVVNRLALTSALEADFLRDSETRLRKLIEYLGDAVVVIDKRGIIQSFNRSATTLFAYTADEVINKNISMLMPEPHKSAHDGYLARYLRTGSSGLIDAGPRPVDALHKNGQLMPVELIISDAGEGSDSRFIGIIRDVAEQNAKMDRLAAIANYDQLTGLCNRGLFNKRLEHEISLAKRQKRMLAVMFLDLDEFKAVNDDYGHDAGDALLKHVAVILEQSVRESDSVARIGGDEFCVLLESITDPTNPARVATKILQAFAEPVRVGDNNFDVTTSIGIALYPDDALDLETLMKNADTAMYFAKNNGKNQYKIYDKSMG